MKYLDKLVLKQTIGQKLMINAIGCSILGSPSTTYYDEMYNGVYKSTVLESTVKHLMKETIVGCMAVRNLVRIGGNIRAEISIMEKVSLKEMIGRSIYNTIKTIYRGNFSMNTSSSQCQAIMCINRWCHCFKPRIKYKGSISKNINEDLC